MDFPSTDLPTLSNKDDEQAVRKSILDLLDKVNQLSSGATVPSGSVCAYAGSSLPSGWYWCDGSAYSRSSESSLYKAIGVQFGSGDGSSTFNVPDLRAATIRGVGTSTEFTQNVTITLAQAIDDMFQGHRYLNGAEGQTNDTTGATWSTYGQVATGTAAKTAAASSSSSAHYQGYTSLPQSDTTNGPPRTGNETTGKAIGLNWIIKR